MKKDPQERSEKQEDDVEKMMKRQDDEGEEKDPEKDRNKYVALSFGLRGCVLRPRVLSSFIRHC